ncbi:DUF1559 domain-containing protein [Aquisphaera giovannonii]|uniref:DUF1559 domain-containing protein n=1 Tax=Aquisphaera giovannonii TaxID=406548 RepID=UPI001FE7845A|nr:DUF1559 domain-containing protein [Aquisphaera giovannonii]
MNGILEVGRASARPAARLLLAAVAVCLIPAATASAQATSSGGRYFPQKDLIAYFDFEGLDAHGDAWKQTSAQKLLNDTKLGALLEDLAGQVVGLAQKDTPEDKRMPADTYLALVKRAARDGFAVAAFGEAPRNVRAGLVLRKANRPDVTGLIETATKPAPGGDQPAPKTETQKGRAVHQIQELVWWAEGDDLVVSNKDGFEAITDVADGKAPSAAGNPLVAPLAKGEDGVVPVAYGFFDLTALPPMSPDAVKLGFDGLKRVEVQWGFQEDALMTSVRFVAPSPRRGVLAMFDQPALTLKSLPPIPAGRSAFAAFSVDPLKTYEQFVAISKEQNPASAEGFDAMEGAIRGQLGFDLRTDLLKNLGPGLALYSQGPAVAMENLDVQAAMLAAYGGLTVSLQARDEDALAKHLETLVNVANQAISRPGGNSPQLRKREGKETIYTLEFPPGTMPPQFASLSPSVGLGKDQLVISGTVEGVEKALALSAPGAARWAPEGAFARPAERLPKEFFALYVSDPSETLPQLIPNLPQLLDSIKAQIPPGVAANPLNEIHIDADKLPKADELKALLFPATTAITTDAQGMRLVQREPLPSLTSPATAGVLAGLMLPAVQSAREAARRAQCVNNEKQIMLAMHNYHSANNAFPRDITDKDGKPLLSWRVAILPFIEQNDLYMKFKLDEPWDSPNNKPLLAEMPKAFLCPSLAKADPTMTTYRGFEGPGAMFEAGQDIGMAAVTDGTSNTIMIVEAKEAAPWTKPGGLAFDQGADADPAHYGAGSSHPGGFNAGFDDGSVRFIKDTVAVQVFKALVTRAGGEVIAADQF